MKRVFAIAKAELQVLFYSPIAWFILVAFIVQSCLAYFSYIQSIPDIQNYGHTSENITFASLVFNYRPAFLLQMIQYLFFYIPLLTMGIMSREISSGSIKLLFSSPISNTQIIFGKFLAIMGYALLMVGVLFMFVLHGSLFIENFDWGFIWIALLGIFLLICAYASVGLFMSSITSYQMVAALSSLVILTFFGYVGSWWQDVAFVREITYWLAMPSRAQTFAYGLFCTEDFLYYITVIGMFLTLAILRLRNRREKSSRMVIVGRYILLFSTVIMVAYISSRPIFTAYYDGTRSKTNTLSVESQEIVGKLKGEYNITTYVNIFDRLSVAWSVLPPSEVRDMKEIMGTYTRFKYDLELDYVYYHSPKGEGFEEYQKKHKDSTYEEIVEKACERMNINPNMLLAESDVVAIEPLVEKEDYKSIKVITAEDGAKGIIRYFQDMMIIPSESEISAAFKRMYATEFPKVGVSVGHEERPINITGDLSYVNFTSRDVRSSLYNQGLDVSEISFRNPIPEDMNIVVIADPRIAFSEEELVNYNNYLERGGNLMLLGEPNRQEKTNPLFAPLGVQLDSGRIVKNFPGNRADMLIHLASEESEKLSYFFKLKRQDAWKKNITPSAAGLLFTEDKGFNKTVIFETDTLPMTSFITNDSDIIEKDQRAWKELSTTNFDDEKPKYEPERGDVEERNFTLVAALDRKVGNKTQKIIVSGDADFISNNYLGGFKAANQIDNATVLMGMFEWISDGAVPVDIRHPEPIDNYLDISVEAMPMHKNIFLYLIPILCVIIAFVINLRRRSK